MIGKQLLTSRNVRLRLPDHSQSIGNPVSVLREGDKQIPVVTRLRMEERAQLEDIQNLYVYSRQGGQKVPLRSVCVR